MYTRILLASDGSECAIKAAYHAAIIAKMFNSAITIIHVFSLPPSFTAFAETPGIELDAATLDQYEKEVEESVISRTGHVLKEEGVKYETLMESGHPAEVILQVAHRESYDLIVLGSRGISEFRAFLLGSTADRVTHHAHCPVLVVK